MLLLRPKRSNPSNIMTDSENVSNSKMNVTPSRRVPLADISGNRLQVGNNGLLSGAIRVPIKDAVKDKSVTPKSQTKHLNPTNPIVNIPATNLNFMKHTEASMK